MIAQQIEEISPVLVASSAYLARAGRPERPEDLSGHNCIGNGAAGRPMTWRFEGPEGPISTQVHGSVSVNNSEVACRIALAGHGIVSLPGFQVLDHIREGRLIRILRDYPAPAIPDPFALSLAAKPAGADPGAHGFRG